VFHETFGDNIELLREIEKYLASLAEGRESRFSGAVKWWFLKKYDVIVVGAGHADAKCLAAARMDCEPFLLRQI
jgi:hypothetical protein